MADDLFRPPRPPVPRFHQDDASMGRDRISQEAGGDHSSRASVIAASAAALEAAASATPAQKERLMEEAVSKALSDPGKAAASGGAQSKLSGPPVVEYSPPDWSGMPNSAGNFGMEVMREGTIIRSFSLSSKPYYTFGRIPGMDVMLDHPTSSRLHAVIQYRGEDGAPLLFDPGSTHGTFLNKNRVPPREYTLIRVGDMIRFGQSSRRYIFTGSPDFLPEEGPNREQRRQLAALEAMALRKEREAAIAKTQMESALNGGASWGFQEDAMAEPSDLDDLDWRAYATTKGLSDKQQKLADKIRKFERQVATLETESDRIRAKQKSMEDLTSGQAATLLRNERQCDRAREEIEELEETLLESLRDSIRAKSGTTASSSQKGPSNKKRGLKKSSDGEDSYDEEDDMVYDRTKKKESHKRKKESAPEEVLDAATLLARKSLLAKELELTEKQLQEEKKVVTALQASSGQNNKTPSVAATDTLDSFMEGVDTRLETDKVVMLENRLQELQGEIDRTHKLLWIADPDGLFSSGSQAAREAILQATQKLEMEKANKKKTKAQQQATASDDDAMDQAAATKQETQLPPEPVPAEELQQVTGTAAITVAKEEVQPSISAGVDHLEGINTQEMEARGGLEIRKRPVVVPPEQQTAISSYEARRAHIAKELKLRSDRSENSKPVQSGTTPQAQVLADLDLLLAGRRQRTLEESEEQPGEEYRDEEEWRPPAGQSGDGRSQLNDALGY